VSAKLMGRFADCLAEEIAGGTQAPPAAEEAGGAAATARPEPPPGPAGDSAEAAARAPERRAPEVLDLAEASREAMLKRIAPVAAVLLGLIVLLGIRRRGR
jgi:uncharacterized protein